MEQLYPLLIYLSFCILNLQTVFTLQGGRVTLARRYPRAARHDLMSVQMPGTCPFAMQAGSSILIKKHFFQGIYTVLIYYICNS